MKKPETTEEYRPREKGDKSYNSYNSYVSDNGGSEGDKKMTSEGAVPT